MGKVILVLALREGVDVSALSDHAISMLDLQGMFIERLIATFDPNLSGKYLHTLIPSKL